MLVACIDGQHPLPVPIESKCPLGTRWFLKLMTVSCELTGGPELLGKVRGSLCCHVLVWSIPFGQVCCPFGPPCGPAPPLGVRATSGTSLQLGVVSGTHSQVAHSPTWWSHVLSSFPKDVFSSLDADQTLRVDMQSPLQHCLRLSYINFQ